MSDSSARDAVLNAVIASLRAELQSEVQYKDIGSVIDYENRTVKRCIDRVEAIRKMPFPETPLDLKYAQSAELWVESPSDFLDGWGGKQLPSSFQAYAERLYRVYKALSMYLSRVKVVNLGSLEEAQFSSEKGGFICTRCKEVTNTAYAGGRCKACLDRALAGEEETQP